MCSHVSILGCTQTKAGIETETRLVFRPGRLWPTFTAHRVQQAQSLHLPVLPGLVAVRTVPGSVESRNGAQLVFSTARQDIRILYVRLSRLTEPRASQAGKPDVLWRVVEFFALGYESALVPLAAPARRERLVAGKDCDTQSGATGLSSAASCGHGRFRRSCRGTRPWRRTAGEGPRRTSRRRRRS